MKEDRVKPSIFPINKDLVMVEIDVLLRDLYILNLILLINLIEYKFKKLPIKSGYFNPHKQNFDFEYYYGSNRNSIYRGEGKLKLMYLV
jgi:hypothetical protein